MNINKARLSAHYSKFPAITNKSPPFLSGLPFVVMFPACVRAVIVEVALQQLVCAPRLCPEEMFICHPVELRCVGLPDSVIYISAILFQDCRSDQIFRRCFETL